MEQSRRINGRQVPPRAIQPAPVRVLQTNIRLSDGSVLTYRGHQYINEECTEGGLYSTNRLLVMAGAGTSEQGAFLYVGVTDKQASEPSAADILAVKQALFSDSMRVVQLPVDENTVTLFGAVLGTSLADDLEGLAEALALQTQQSRSQKVFAGLKKVFRRGGRAL